MSVPSNRKAIGLYEKGMLWGRDGYSISIGGLYYGNNDPRFFFGSLAEAKRNACKAFGIHPDDVKWTRFVHP